MEPSDKQLTSTEPKEPAVKYVHTNSFPDLLKQLGISLLVSTYQAQRIMLVTAGKERLSTLMRCIDKPTGIALSGTRMAVVSRREVWYFENAGEIRDSEGKSLPYDLCWAPRRCHVSGNISGHEALWLKDELVVVNSLFSCLCTFEPESSFKELWRPPFISQLAPEDRCHLNGLCANGHELKYASAFSASNTAKGWKETKESGGVIIDIPSGEIAAQGLCMPHSPRLYADNLWILNSGKGELCIVDQNSGKVTAVAQFPGYLRGLAFHGSYAFVGLCQVREDRDIFGGIALDALGERKCGIYVLDITRGTIMGYIEFTKGIEELFDIHVISGPKAPHIIGFEEDTLDGLFVMP